MLAGDDPVNGHDPSGMCDGAGALEAALLALESDEPYSWHCGDLGAVMITGHQDNGFSANFGNPNARGGGYGTGVPGGDGGGSGTSAPSSTPRPNACSAVVSAAAGAYGATQDWGDQATDYWAQQSNAPTNDWADDAIDWGGGLLSSLWTHETAGKTASVLAGAYVVRVIGPVSPRGLPPYVGRIRKYLRFDPPHHSKGWGWDGVIPKQLGRLLSSVGAACTPGRVQ